MLKAKIIGACGYGGVGMIELLLSAPKAEIIELIDIAHIGEPISSVFPHLLGFCDIIVKSIDEDDPGDNRANALFIATPDGVGMELASPYAKNNIPIVDYSGDFRFQTCDLYEKYAKQIGRNPKHKSPELLPLTVYGLPELHRKQIKEAKIVGNPGCFAVASILSIAPAIQAGIINHECIIFDAKTGVSGAGIKPSATFHYPARYENMNAYKIGQHQHVVEIEHELKQLSGKDVKVTLNTQVVPLTRGIMVCCYSQLNEGFVDVHKIHTIYKNFYQNEKFVHILPIGCSGNSSSVRGSNSCHISINVDQKTGLLLSISYIDNLLKGQAGTALQNMNLLHGLDETFGLTSPGMLP